ncbi:MAG: putative lipoprotein [Pseudohongiellaceae bacterium]|jgi:predicted lipoprotein
MERCNRPIYLVFFFWLLISQASLAMAIEPESVEESAEFSLLKTITNVFVVPNHQNLSQAVTNLTSAMVGFCTNKNEKTYLSAQQAWQEAMKVWSSLSAINYGPIDENNISWRFQFWPDPINLVSRKFKSRLSGRNKAITADELAAASIAIQGLNAIEFLLFDDSVGQAPAFQAKPYLCDIALATTHNLLNYSKVLQVSWESTYAERWHISSGATRHNLDLKRQLENLYSGWVMSLDAIYKNKLSKPLGLDEKLEKSSKMINPWLLESWRSRHSIQSIEASLISARRMYEMDKGFSWYLTQKKSKNLALDKRIRHMFRKVFKRLEKITLSAYELIQLEKTEQLESLTEEVATLYLMLKLDYAKAANINFRFNAHDGD